MKLSLTYLVLIFVWVFFPDLWETQCIHEFISLEEFAAWGKSNEDKSNPLHRYKPEDFSCYIDYKYMRDIATDKILKVKCSGCKFLDGCNLFSVDFALPSKWLKHIMFVMSVFYRSGTIS